MSKKNTKSVCFSVSEVAEHLGIGKTLAYELFHSKGFPSFVIPGTRKRLIRREALELWIREQENQNS